MSFSNEADELKQQTDRPHYSSSILHKQAFYELLVEKGLVYMYDNGYDVDHDSPIFTSEQVLQVKFRDNDEDVLKQVCIRFNSFEKKIHEKNSESS